MTDFTLLHVLKDVLGFVDGHVRFAETKNAAVLVFSAGSLYAIAQVIAACLNSNLALPVVVKLYLLFLVSCLGLSILFALLSFYPKQYIHIPPGKGLRELCDGNLLFFDEIQFLEPLEYTKRLCTASGISTSGRSFTCLELMYSQEIIVNARIACRKFLWFKASLWAVLIGLIPPVFAAIIVYRLVRLSCGLGSSCPNPEAQSSQVSTALRWFRR